MNAVYQIPDASDVLAYDRIAAMNAAAQPVPFAYSVQDILNRASFARNEWGTLTDFAGRFLQSAMDVTIDGNHFTVYAKREESGLEWSVRCPNFRQAMGETIILAVQRRIQANREARN